MTTESFSCIDLAAQPMADEQRSGAFRAAIAKVVKPGMTVINIGAGSALLAMFAAKAGADKVVAVERDEFVASVARENVAQNGLTDKVDVIVVDALKYRFASYPQFDVAIVDLLTTAMIDEAQIDVIRNLYRRSVVSENTIFIPEAVNTVAQLVHMDYAVCGLDMKMVRHLWFDFPHRNRVVTRSLRSELSAVRFAECPEPWVDKILEFEISSAGIVNGIHLSSQTVLCESQILGDTLTLNAPVVIPIQERVVEAGERTKARISYVYGQGFGSMRIEISDNEVSQLEFAA
jgi:predicted RNA methylase